MNQNFQKSVSRLGQKIQARPRTLIVLALAILGAGIFYYRMNSAPQGGGPMGMGGPGGMVSLVDAAKVERKPIYDSITAVGTLLGQESVVLRPEFAGVIEKVHFEEGQDVKKDQLLISIDSDIQSADMAQAQANLALAQANFDRSQRLGKTGATSQQNVDAAKAQLGISTAAVASAKARFDKTELRAPISGRIGIRKISPGNWVAAGTELATLETLNPLKLDFSVPEIFLRSLKSGMLVDITVDALGSEHFSGKVTVVDPLVDERTRSIRLRAEIENKDIKLRPGLFARVSIPLQQAEQPLTIPEAALVPVADKTLVFKIADGKAEQVEIKTGLRNAGIVEVSQGLNENDQVVTAGQMRLRGGMPVKVREAPQQKAPEPAKGQGK
ncbi:MAG: efflux RND transporter periplasmic adaptor subunit [Pseudomonadota bacterium]